MKLAGAIQAMLEVALLDRLFHRLGSNDPSETLLIATYRAEGETLSKTGFPALARSLTYQKLSLGHAVPSPTSDARDNWYAPYAISGRTAKRGAVLTDWRARASRNCRRKTLMHLQSKWIHSGGPDHREQA